jgi:amidophosphoribosyltransferase
VAFEAAVALLRERGQDDVLDHVYRLCKMSENDPKTPAINHVKRIYQPFTDEEIAVKISDLVRPRDIAWTGQVKIVFQTVAGLRWAISGHTGDWYFTGDYPTAGGFKVVNRAFINYIEKRGGRAYEARA